MGKYSEQRAAGRDQKSEILLWERLSSRDIIALTIYRFLLTPDYWALLGPRNGGESHDVRSQRRQSGSE
jgi:hypothetical protein